jgi:hypothetical protein
MTNTTSSENPPASGESSDSPEKDRQRRKPNMAHVRKDTLAKPKEWAKHLRPFGKRKQAKTERKTAQKEIQKEMQNTPDQ